MSEDKFREALQYMAKHRCEMSGSEDYCEHVLDLARYISRIGFSIWGELTEEPHGWVNVWCPMCKATYETDILRDQSAFALAEKQRMNDENAECVNCNQPGSKCDCGAYISREEFHDFGFEG